MAFVGQGLCCNACCSARGFALGKSFSGQHADLWKVVADQGCGSEEVSCPHALCCTENWMWILWCWDKRVFWYLRGKEVHDFCDLQGERHHRGFMGKPSLPVFQQHKA